MMLATTDLNAKDCSLSCEFCYLTMDGSELSVEKAQKIIRDKKNHYTRTWWIRYDRLSSPFPARQRSKQSWQRSMDLKFPLKEYGLTEKEIEIYLELLPLGSAPLQEVAKRIDSPRSTVYHILNSLSQKGIIAKIVKEKITHYQATDPEKIRDRLEEKMRLVDEILPQLKNLRKSIKEPSSVEIYEGIKGIHTILADVVRVKQQLYYFGGYKRSLSVLKHLPNHVRHTRIEKGIPAKMVYDPVDEPILHTKEYQDVSELRFLENMKEFPGMFFIHGDKVSMFSHKTDLVGITMKNKDLAQCMLLIFNTFWKAAKPASFPQDMRLSEVMGQKTNR